MTMITDTKPVTKRPRKMAREPQVQDAAANGVTDVTATQSLDPVPKRPSKYSLVLELLARPEGTTIDQLVAATSWLPHTTRAALTGLKKKGHTITSDKADGSARVYRVASV